MRTIIIKRKLIIFIISFILIFIIGISIALILTNKYPLKYENEILFVSAKYNVEPELIAGVIFSESGFKQYSVSNKGAVGLMQLMPSTASWLCEMMDIPYNQNLLFNPLYNLNIGAFYLSYLIEKFQEINVVLAAYNAGEGNVVEWLSNREYSVNGKILVTTPFKQTNFYIAKVNNAMIYYKSKLQN
ncbi:MAG: lytic transglycosylase domain-containing protein [Clostridia bacterium]|nr:lytic transglycosylase domain-containing protein [Clostridia bacterium]